MMTKIRKCDGAFVETDIDDEKVVLNLETGEFFSLSGTGRQIWSMLGTTKDRTGLIAALAKEYGARDDRIAADLDLFLAELQTAGLVQTG